MAREEVEYACPKEYTDLLMEFLNEQPMTDEGLSIFASKLPATNSEV